MDPIFYVGRTRGGLTRRDFVPVFLDVAAVGRGISGNEILGRVIYGLYKDDIAPGVMRGLLSNVAFFLSESQKLSGHGVTQDLTGEKWSPVGSPKEQTLS